MGALVTAVRQGKALYAGISSYSARHTAEAARILRDMGTPLLIHQPSYSLLNRWIEEDLLDVLGDEGVGAIVFSPLAQGMLTTKYLDAIPQERGQSLAQMALAWTLRDPRVASTLIGASSVRQLEENVRALAQPSFA